MEEKCVVRLCEQSEWGFVVFFFNKTVLEMRTA